MTLAIAIARARSEGRHLLTEVEAKDALAAADLPVVTTRLASTADEAAAIARDVGYPVVCKITSPDIVHKSDVGGVRVALADEAAVRRAFDEILAAAQAAVPDARIHGVAVQRMAPAGVELIVGVTTDPQFGPVIMFGTGGVLVELFRDVAFRVVPLAPRDAREMVHEIRGVKLLQGFRGQPACDVAAVERLLCQVSDFVEANPQVRELDLNPVFAYPEGVTAVDARIVLSEED